ncbi:Endoribonuclease YbeY [Buchnera aphidicola (Eriosoma grossulariae)]|uniref:rRNA maturation RNase YbeY n=1 Tax=Buchnera aphidicola TaxID=9 RepID=UPI0034647F5A
MNILQLNLQIISCDNSYIPKKKYFKKWLIIVLKNQSIHAKITIRIVNELEIKKLNKQYRKQNKITNILSFAYFIPYKKNQCLIGDLVICSKKIQEESIKQKKSFKSHWAHIIIHGILHLLGYNHIKKLDRVYMELIEINYLYHFGFKNPYISKK